ncbi:MAG: hypothetical protein KF798_01285 [Candidatus Paracaedibacteraceae bacterium]|nr:hypothetical protein [Candidatus Paracaedibacteraceae bacterium]
MTTVRLFLEFFLVYQDWRFLSVPLWGVILYGAVTVAATPHFYSDTLMLTLFLVGGIWGWEFYASKSYLGLADKIILPIIATGIPLTLLGGYLILVGCLALGTAYLWQRCFHSARYPLLPALIFARICYSGLL